MTVGINSYVTIDEANEYTSAFYSGTPAAEAWAAKTDTEKELLLITACSDIDSLPFVGAKSSPAQTLAFPRGGASEVPQRIKSAQVEITLLPFREEVQKMLADAATRAALQKQGVTSYSIGNLSESYSRNTGVATAYDFMADAKINKLLRGYLLGGYRVC